MGNSLKRFNARLIWGFLTAASALVMLLSMQGCGGPTLKPWHSVHLDEEFTAEKAAEIGSFDAYLALEDRLFAQLEEEVYTQVPTGPEHALVRYSAGSAADPQRRTPNWNRSFELKTEQPVGGILLLHGLTDAPYTFRALAERLHQRGYWVVGLRLPGHGTAPSGLASVRWQDMAAAVRLAMAHLGERLDGRPVHIAGYSTGAPLALDFTLDALQGDASPLPASLLLISPAIGVHAAAALAQWKRRLSYLPGLGGLAWLQILPEFDPYKYNSFATNAGEQVHSVTRSVARRIAAWETAGRETSFPPTLVFKSTVDATVSTEAVVDNLLEHLEADRHELVLFDINRYAVKSTLLITDPDPLTARVTDAVDLPFAVTLVSNENDRSGDVVARRKPPRSLEMSAAEPLGLAWPRGVISLSHVALPFPPDDPLYGRRPPDNDDVLFLGEMSIQGERGLLKLPTDWLLRLRYNPFYDYLERRVLEWLQAQGG